MSTRSLLGFTLAVAGFTIPFFIHIDGLSFAGHAALSLFLLAAALWMFEPIPIYATSLLVILLGILLLSSEGLIYSGDELPVVAPEDLGGNRWGIPASALEGDRLYVVTPGAAGSTPVRVQVLEQTDGEAVVQSQDLDAARLIASDARHPLAGFRPSAPADYLNTLANSVIILFLGGLLLAEAAVKYNLDRNLSRIILKPFGTRPSSIVFGLLLVTGSVSAFMSNTAATAMMMTVILPILATLAPGDRFKMAVVLAIPIGANIGGIATPVGTPPNAVALAGLAKQGIIIPFGSWVVLALPVVLVMLVFAWRLLLVLFPPSVDRLEVKLTGTFDRSGRAIALYVIAGLTVSLWITEALHGISSSIVSFGSVAALAMTGVIGEREIRRIPWEVLWLVAGGIALDVALRTTGLAAWFVSAIHWDAFGGFGVVLIFGVVAILLSEFLSNTVCATLMMPLAIGVGAAQADGDPRQIILTALVVGIGVSFAMALPISTPPNAIAMSTGLLKTNDLARVGMIVGIAGLVLLLILGELYWPLVLSLL